MKNLYKIIFSIILLSIIVITITYNIKKNNKEKTQVPEPGVYISEVVDDECTEEYRENQESTTVTSTQEKVSANAELILKKYYSKCDHTINEYVELPKELVNLTKDEVQEKYQDWKVIGFEPNKITLYKEFDDLCGEHFKLKVENGKITIYTISDDGTESIYERTNISSEYLTETDLINMQDGLEIYGKEELNKIIEDFE